MNSFRDTLWGGPSVNRGRELLHNGSKSKEFQNLACRCSGIVAWNGAMMERKMDLMIRCCAAGRPE